MDTLAEESPVSPPIDSKALFLEACQLPTSDRLQINIGRVLHSLRSTELERLKADGVPGPTGEAEEDEQILAAGARVLSRLISNQPRGELISALREVVATLRTHASKDKGEVELESFDGFVEQVDGDTAYVTLKSREYGDVQDGEYPAALLLKCGIKEQCPFLCKTVDVNGTIRIDIEAVPDVPVTDEQLRAIDEKIDRVLPRDDPGIEY